MQDVAFSSIAIVGVCVCVYVCVCVCPYTPRWCITGKRFEINLHCFHHPVSHKKPSNNVFGDVVDPDLDLLYEGEIFELIPFW